MSRSLEQRFEHCVHCSRLIGTFEGGYGAVWDGEGSSKRMVRVCHPHVRGRPNCYSNIVTYHHVVRDCKECSEGAAGR